MPKRGDSFHIDTGVGEGGQAETHLFFVLLEPGAGGKTIIANVETIRPGGKHDLTTVLQAGEHTFIKHPSCVVYRMARIVTSDRIDSLVQEKKARPDEPLPEEPLDRICRGLLRSPYTKAEVREMYEENLFAQI